MLVPFRSPAVASQPNSPESLPISPVWLGTSPTLGDQLQLLALTRPELLGLIQTFTERVLDYSMKNPAMIAVVAAYLDTL